MLRIACSATFLELQLPSCGDDDAANYSATLSRALVESHTLTVTIPEPEEGDAARLHLALPDQSTTPIKRGLWTLSVKTPCGCYVADVYAEGCGAPALIGTHRPTRDLPAPTPVSCAPALQPDLGAAAPVLGFVFARNDDGTVTGIDLQADPPYGSQIPPHPTFLATAIDAELHGLLLEGTLAPVPNGLDNTPFALLDRDGRTLATGTLAVALGVATLSATLTAYLGCGPHYLTIGAP